MNLNLKDRKDCTFDEISLGEIMLRLDPGEGRIKTARSFKAWEGGGEYNVARGLRRCFGMKTAVVTAFAENEIGYLLEDLVLQAGGLTEAASSVKVDVYRRINNAHSLEDDERLTETFSFALKDGFVIDGEQGFVLRPYDQVVVRKSPSYTEQQNVTVTGAVNFSGEYAMTSKNFRLSDLIKAA